MGKRARGRDPRLSRRKYFAGSRFFSRECRSRFISRAARSCPCFSRQLRVYCESARLGIWYIAADAEELVDRAYEPIHGEFLSRFFSDLWTIKIIKSVLNLKYIFFHSVENFETII